MIDGGGISVFALQMNDLIGTLVVQFSASV
jgi:hypothetical protein